METEPNKWHFSTPQNADFPTYHLQRDLGIYFFYSATFCICLVYDSDQMTFILAIMLKIGKWEITREITFGWKILYRKFNAIFERSFPIKNESKTNSIVQFI